MAFDRESSSVSLSNLDWSVSQTWSPGSHPPVLAWQKETCWANWAAAGAGQNGNLANAFSGSFFTRRNFTFPLYTLSKQQLRFGNIWVQGSFGRGTLSLENKTRNIAVFRNLISVWMSYVYSSPTMSPVFYFYQSVSFNVDNYFHFYAILKTERNICSTSYFFKCKHFSFVNGTC